MLTYLLKRLVAMVPTLLGITLVTFLVISLAPGDPVAISFGAGSDERTNEGGGQAERQVDTIKAKKKLLGMMSEEHAVIAWKAESEPLPPPDPAADADHVEAAHFKLQRERRPAELPAWQHALALSPDGSLVYTAGDDGAVHVIDAATRREKSAWPTQGVELLVVAISADGSRIATGDVNGTITAWDAGTGTVLGAATPASKVLRSLAFLPDGRLLSGSDDGTIRLHSLPALEVVATFSAHIGGVFALAVAPEDGVFWSGGYDRKLREWNAVQPSDPARVVVELPQAINDFALSPSATRLAVACDDRGAYIAPTEGKGSWAAFKGHYKSCTAVAFSPDGRTLYTGSRDETVRSWDVASARPIGMNPETAGVVHDLLVSRDGMTLWSAADSWAKVPAWKRYLRWLGRVVTFDFDRSFTDDRKVSEKMAVALPVSIGLNLLALFIAYAVSIPLGVKAAVERGSRFDSASSLMVFVLYSVPNFWFGTMLILLLSSKQNLDILPSVGLQSLNSGDLPYFSWLWDRVSHLILPLCVLTYASFAALSRYARTSMLEVIGQDYIRTARAKGLPESVVIYKHALRNSLITIVTLVANLLPAMIGGSIIVESIFNIQGMGKLSFDAILSRDYPVIMAVTTFSALLTQVGILISDVLYSIVDPRISHS